MKSLLEIVAASARARPDKPALIYHDRPISYAELDEWIRRMAGALHELGVSRWDQVGILAGNIPEFVYAFFGVLRLGAVASPLNIFLTPDEVGAILADSGAEAVIVEIDYVPTVLEARKRAESLHHILVIGPPPTPAGTRSLDELLDRAGPPPEVDVDRDDLAVLAYTAGTTASPKGVMLTHGNLLSNLDQIWTVPTLREMEADVVLLALPLFHIYALNAALDVTLREGATAVLVDRFDPAETLSMVQKHGVTVLAGVPQMYQAWLAAAETGSYDLSSVRLAVSGAAPLPPEVLEDFHDRFGIAIQEGYGLTETSPVVTTNAVGEEAKGGSIGLPLPGVEVRLLDVDGKEVADGDPGEVMVRGPNVFRGYWKKEPETEAAFREGWFRTGDVAYRDHDGYLFLVDRKKDLIIVSGFNVYPAEVEDVLNAHPAVAECAVIGVPDERTGEAVKVFVVRAPGTDASEDELLEHCREHLARFKLPQSFEFVTDLPKHITGKVLRRHFRE